MKAVDARTLRDGIEATGGMDVVDAFLPLPDCDTLAAWPAQGEQRTKSLARFLLRRMDLTGTSAALVSIPAPALLSDVLGIVRHAPTRLRAVVPGNAWLDAATLGNLARHGVAAIAVDGADLAAAGEAAAGALMRRLGAFGLHLQLSGSEAYRAVPFVLGHAVPVVLDYRIGDVQENAASFGISRSNHADLWLRLRLAHDASPLAIERASRHIQAHSTQRMIWGGGRRRPGAILSALPALIPGSVALAGVLGANARWLVFGADLDWNEFGDAA
ncbi:hypothetical protein [Roseixanthobacter pseudopolyaromaticivorans]|uniref:hypothetical protein n=1 Tax=Xanthobacteraceae TaxID=335928 RepID=UPI003726AFBD